MRVAVSVAVHQENGELFQFDPFECENACYDRIWGSALLQAHG